MTKSELIERLAGKHPDMTLVEVEKGVKIILDQMIGALLNKGRIEIRGFGSYSLRHREPKVGRNPKTGESVELPAKYALHFKAGKLLKDNINENRKKYPLS